MRLTASAERRTPAPILALAVALLVAACGGNGGAPTPEPDLPAATQAATGGGTEPTQSSNGRAAVEACALLTADEVTAATGQPGIEAQPVADGETDALSTCGYVSNDVLPVVIVSVLDPANTNTDAASYLALPGSVDVPVNGARAIFMPAAGFVMAVVKGDTVATIQVAMPAEGEDFQVAATRLVQPVADRMP